MTEQTESRTDDYGPFVEDLGRLFTSWEFADGRECVGGDLAEHGPVEMARQFGRAESFMEGLVMAGERAFDFGTYMVLLNALDHTRKARKVAEEYASAAGEKGES